MEEYELLEVEIQTIYEIYSVRFQNIHSLKKIEILQKMEKEQIQASERSTKRIPLELHEEDLKILQENDDNFSIKIKQLEEKKILKDEKYLFLTKEGNTFMGEQVNTHILRNRKNIIGTEIYYPFDLLKQIKNHII